MSYPTPDSALSKPGAWQTPNLNKGKKNSKPKAQKPLGVKVKTNPTNAKGVSTLGRGYLKLSKNKATGFKSRYRRKR